MLKARRPDRSGVVACGLVDYPPIPPTRNGCFGKIGNPRNTQIVAEVLKDIFIGSRAIWDKIES
jgi:hypothetical protein